VLQQAQAITNQELITLLAEAEAVGTVQAALAEVTEAVEHLVLAVLVALALMLNLIRAAVVVLLHTTAVSTTAALAAQV
jgi:hypothetical protein